MFNKSKPDNFYLYGTEVDNLFISEFMADAPGEYVKAYLLGLMYASTGMQAGTDAVLRQLGMSRGEYEDCLSYWEERNVIRRVENKNDAEGRFEVEFVNLRELAFGSAGPKREESVLDDKQLAKLYRDVQAATGRLINQDEMKLIAGLVSDYEINPELIAYCYGYCAANRKSSSGRYVAKVLKDWKSKGIETAVQAASYLDQSDARFADYKAIFAELGFYRNPTAEERRTMNAWFAKGFSLNEMLEACKKTVGISSPNIKYVDAVLNKTREEAKTENGGESTAVKVNRLYENIRNENAQKTEANRREVLSHHPEIAKLENDIKNEMLSMTGAMVRRDQKAFTESKLRIEGLEAEKTKALTGFGYSADILDEIYSCSICKDTGVTEDGNTCSCYAEKLQMLQSLG